MSWTEFAPSVEYVIKQQFIIIPSNLSPCPCPRHSAETAMAAISPHLSSKKGKRAAHAMIWPSLSTTTNESNDSSSCNNKTGSRHSNQSISKLHLSSIGKQNITTHKLGITYWTVVLAKHWKGWKLKYKPLHHFYELRYQPFLKVV